MSTSTYARTRHGKIGQDIVHNTTTPFQWPQPSRPSPPNQSDLRLNSRGQPIPNTRQYAQRALTRAEDARLAADIIAMREYIARDDPTDEEPIMFDPDDVELTPEASRQLDKDTDIYFKCLTHSSAEFETRKAQDDAFLNVVISTVSKLVQDTIKTNPLWPSFCALPYSDCSRTKAYLAIIRDQYSKGNSTTTVTAISKLFSMTQTTDTTAVFISNVCEQANRVKPLIESKTYPGYVKFDKLLSLVLIKGLDKKQLPNLRALEIHMQTHAANVLDVPDQLMNSVISMQTSDLATLSDHDAEPSAFLSSIPYTPKKPTTSPTKKTSDAVPTKRGKGVKIPSRDDHCPNCFKILTAQNNPTPYYYHLAKDCLRSSSKAFPATVIDDEAVRAARVSQLFASLRQDGYEFFAAPDPSSDA